MTESVGVAEAKSRISELVARAGYSGERFLIERRGKPVAAIVSAEDLTALEAREPVARRRGILAAVGALADFEEWEGIIEDVVRQRQEAREREVSLEWATSSTQT